MTLIVPALAERSAMFASPSAAPDRASAILHTAPRYPSRTACRSTCF
jgi:hypothetical protein